MKLPSSKSTIEPKVATWQQLEADRDRISRERVETQNDLDEIANRRVHSSDDPELGQARTEVERLLRAEEAATKELGNAIGFLERIHVARPSLAEETSKASGKRAKLRARLAVIQSDLAIARGQLSFLEDRARSTPAVSDEAAAVLAGTYDHLAEEKKAEEHKRQELVRRIQAQDQALALIESKLRQGKAARNRQGNLDRKDSYGKLYRDLRRHLSGIKNTIEAEREFRQEMHRDGIGFGLEPLLIRPIVELFFTGGAIDQLINRLDNYYGTESKDK